MKQLKEKINNKKRGCTLGQNMLGQIEKRIKLGGPTMDQVGNERESTTGRIVNVLSQYQVGSKWISVRSNRFWVDFGYVKIKVWVLDYRV